MMGIDVCRFCGSVVLIGEFSCGGRQGSSGDSINLLLGCGLLKKKVDGIGLCSLGSPEKESGWNQRSVKWSRRMVTLCLAAAGSFIVRDGERGKGEKIMKNGLVSEERGRAASF